MLNKRVCLHNIKYEPEFRNDEIALYKKNLQVETSSNDPTYAFISILVLTC